MFRIRSSFLLFGFLLSGCSADNQKQALISANLYAIKEAQKIQSHIKSEQVCPEYIDGWQKQDQSLETIAGAAGAQYKLIFQCYDNLEFSITVKISMDSWIYIRSRATDYLEIQYGHFTNPKTLKILRETDIADVATKAASG